MHAVTFAHSQRLVTPLSLLLNPRPSYPRAGSITTTPSLFLPPQCPHPPPATSYSAPRLGPRVSVRTFPHPPPLLSSINPLLGRRDPSPRGTSLTEGKNRNEIARRGSMVSIAFCRVPSAIHQPLVVCCCWRCGWRCFCCLAPPLPSNRQKKKKCDKWKGDGHLVLSMMNIVGHQYLLL